MKNNQSRKDESSKDSETEGLVNLTFHTKVQDTKKQLVIAIPAGFARTLKIKKGDIFTFKLWSEDAENFKSSVVFNKEASKLLNPGEGKETFNQEDLDKL